MISDLKSVYSSPTFEGTRVRAQALSATDYYPFGQDMPSRDFKNSAFGESSYRFGFNGKEADRKGEWGSGVHYDYGFRIYDPGIAKFLSVDPLTASYPWYTPYQFAGNMPTQAIDLDGLEPVVQDGILIGYNVQKGQGPTQIVADIYNPQTQAREGYALHKKVKWTDIVFANVDKFENVRKGSGKLFDKNNPDYKSGNIRPNIFLMINGGVPKGSIEEPIVDTKPEPIIDSKPKVDSKPKKQNSYLRNKAYSIGYDAVLGGGIGGSIGVVFDNDGDWGIYRTGNANLGIGGGLSFNYTGIHDRTNTDKGFQLTSWAGRGISLWGSVGPIGFNIGANLKDDAKGKGIWMEENRANLYVTEELGIPFPSLFGKSAKVPKIKAKPQLEFGFGTTISSTKFIYRSDNK